MKNRFTILFLILSISILFSTENIFAEVSEPILITISPAMEDVIFDGKWTFFSEWKPSSLTTIVNDGKTIILRTAHYENFIYVFVDSIKDYTLDKGMDKATICFDAKNDKNSHSDKNDYCFSSTLGLNNGIVFQGGSVNAFTGNFQNIPTPKNFVAIGSVSDENDRYTPYPHPSYEFKIPIDLFERSNNYGFYLSVYDASSNTYSSFPSNVIRENYKIPSPNQWGDIVSPDKSMPELNLPILILGILFFTIILVQSKVGIRIFYWK